jgi:hypothetical protein
MQQMARQLALISAGRREQESKLFLDKPQTRLRRDELCAKPGAFNAVFRYEP